jgi:hypothetical protein
MKKSKQIKDVKVSDYQSIEELEGHFEEVPPEDSTGLVKRCHAAQKKLIRDLEIEDMRLLLGQNIGARYILPKAVKSLLSNPLAEGHYYPGDLLNAVAKVKNDAWADHPTLKTEFQCFLRKRVLDAKDPKLSDAIDQDLKTTIQNFVQ